MSLKKKLGSKLASGVRQIKTQRGQTPTVAPAKIAPTVKHTATPTPSKAMAPAKVTAKSVAPRAAQPQPVTSHATRSGNLHPRRVWPD